MSSIVEVLVTIFALYGFSLFVIQALEIITHGFFLANSWMIVILEWAIKRLTIPQKHTKE